MRVTDKKKQRGRVLSGGAVLATTSTLQMVDGLPFAVSKLIAAKFYISQILGILIRLIYTDLLLRVC
ncbi:MAG: hypothetical protein IKZ99_08865 [Salinivirgaceae bacterium]|nr:hypothetical protein [Salinivirgaceae bacterium]